MSADGNLSRHGSWSVRRSPGVRTAIDIELIGTGQVGRSLLRRLATLNADGQGDDSRHGVHGDRLVAATPRLRLVAVANSRGRIANSAGIDPSSLIDTADASAWPTHDDASVRPADDCKRRRRIVVDATASDAIASRHEEWLAQGISVVTANKLGQGACMTRWRSIDRASRQTGAHYGNSATVGAGLPFIRTLDSLVNGGDRLVSLAGVLSGTLAWLFDHYDGSVPFSTCVREAQARGFTEPDPWQDIGGQDVIRKLLILARSTGFGLDADDIEHQPLIPPQRYGDWLALDRAMDIQITAARRAGGVLRYTARLDGDGRAHAGLECLPPDDPLVLGGSNNRLVIRTCRYREQPMLIQGPGAGPDITASALLDDIVRAAADRNAWTGSAAA